MQTENIEKMNFHQSGIQNILSRYLSSLRVDGASHGGHLDEDTVSAFVEGNLTQREGLPVAAHLVECSFCRNITAEIIRLDDAMAENEAITTLPASTEPARISEVLSGILSRIFGAGDSAVFAHGEDEADEKPNDAQDADKN